MHLLETYALSTASKINKPFILKKFFPVPNKYITIHNSSGMAGKCYDYYQEVIDFLYEKLNSNGYQIVQIGSKDDKPLDKAIHLQGVTDIHQTAFILNNSSLHIGNDSFAIHMCSSFNVPLIGLYSISSPEIAGPFWKNENQICLIPDNWVPSFNPSENPKRVNDIKIEKIIESIEKLLFNNTEINIETIHIGNNYRQKIIEALPDQILPPNLFPKQLLNIRYDYINNITDNDYNATFQNLNIRQCSIVTKQPINLEVFFGIKNNLSIIFYDITENIDLDFVNKINSLGYKAMYVFHLNNENEAFLHKRKLDLIDIPQNIEVIKDIEPSFKLNKNSFYKSSKFLFANQKVYPSKAAFMENSALTELKLDSFFKIPETNLETFLKEDLNYTFIFNKN